MTGRYQKYEFCVPYNPKNTILSVLQRGSKEKKNFSNIDIYRKTF